MILLDTHIWIWWVQGDKRLSTKRLNWLDAQTPQGLGVSRFSVWEVAKLVEYQRLPLPVAVNEWLKPALAYPGVELLDLTLPIILEATQLPSPFHKDPADQLIVATARVKQIPLLTADAKILAYPYVNTITP